MPIDWASVNWVYTGVLAVFAFFSTLVGSLLSFNHRGTEAVLSALIFAAIFVLCLPKIKRWVRPCKNINY